MKKSFKRFSIMLLVALCLIIVAIPMCFSSPKTQIVFAETSNINAYYGSKLKGTDKLFYQALQEMDANGNFKSGKSFEIDNNQIAELGKKYAQGDSTLLRSFGSALDSFRFDRTDLFYIDFDMLTVTVTLKNNKYTVSIGAGRTDSFFMNGVTSENVETYITNTNNALTSLIAGIDESATTIEKAKLVNKRIIDRVSYSFGTNTDGSLSVYGYYIRTIFAPLIGNIAVCEGYSRLFKACMDKLGENVILVQGYAMVDGRVEPHMWNYVKNGNNWLGVDVTWNDGEWTQNGNQEKYLLCDKIAMDSEHTPYEIVSTSEYKMPYPELYSDIRVVNDGRLYIEKWTDSDRNEFLNVSFNGKGADKLVEEGIYLAYRSATAEGYGAWWSMEYCALAFDGLLKNFDSHTKINGEALNGIALATYQIAVINKAPDKLVAGSFPVVDGQVKEIYAYYSEVTNDDVICMSDEYSNENYDPTYVIPPYVVSTTPENFFQSAHEIKTYHISVTYDQQLKITDGSNQIKMNYNYKAYNDRVLNDEEIRQNAKIENVTWDEQSTVSFDFTPSFMFAHNDLMWSFYFENVVGIFNGQDGKTPNSFGTAFRYPASNCFSCVLSGSVKTVTSYGQPLLIGNEDLSLSGWQYKDKNGEIKNASENQRSQLALVVSKPKDENEMISSVANSVSEDALLSSSTYELDLNLCAGFTYIPSGANLKLSFGFPDGLDASSEGVVYKVYHFRRYKEGDSIPEGKKVGDLNYDNVEILDCVVTKYGLVVNVSDFSPFVVVALDSSKVETTKKGIVTNFNGIGGSVSVSTGNRTVSYVEESQSITYVFTPQAGFELEYVLLNGKLKPVTDNTLTLSYEELAQSNTLDVGFVSTEVAEKESEEGKENLLTKYVANAQPYEENVQKSENNDLILIFAVLILVLAIVNVLLRVKFKKNKLNNEK